MSEQNESQESSIPEVPQEVKELQQALSDLAGYRNVVTLGMFPGAKSDDLKKLRDFLKTTYEQVLNQFNEHPYVIEIKARDAKDANG